MIPFRSIGLTVGSSSFFVAILLDVGAHAQMAGFVAKPLLQSTVGHDENKDAVLLGITIAPGGSQWTPYASWRLLRYRCRGRGRASCGGPRPASRFRGGGVAQPSRCDS